MLTTGTLTTRDVQNHAEYSAEMRTSMRKIFFNSLTNY